MVNKNNPFMNIGPGEFIKEELEARNWRQEDLASILGISLKSVNKIIMNKQAITIDIAKLLNKAFGQSAQYWINLDINYRLRLQGEKTEEKDVAVKANVYKHMPVNEMIKKGWLNSFKNMEELIEEVKRFWNTSVLDFSYLDKAPSLNFRKSEAYKQYNNYYAWTWFQMAKMCSKTYEVKEYKKSELQDIADNFSNYTTLSDGAAHLIKDINNAGVKFFVLSHLQKTYTDGASFFDDKNPVIVYSARYDRKDNFWFTMAHEIAHVLLHLRKKDDVFIDIQDDVIPKKEASANRLAEKMLKTNDIVKFFKPYKNYISRERVEACASELKTSPSIVVGVLQHHNILSRRNLNDLKTEVSKLIPDAFWAEKNLDKVKRVA